MANAKTPALPASVADTLAMLGSADYVADRSLATAVHLALHLKRPLFLEGEAGVGKTEIAKVLAAALGRALIRLQCYEGLDTASAVYEWNYPRQMSGCPSGRGFGRAGSYAKPLGTDIFAERFLIRRPILQALEPHDGGGAGAFDEPVRPHRRAFRSVSARSARRIPGDDSRARRDQGGRPADRRPYLEPDRGKSTTR